MHSLFDSGGLCMRRQVYVFYACVSLYIVHTIIKKVVVVCALYIWCVATDPADIRVLSFKKRGSSLDNKVAVMSSRHPVEPQAGRHLSSFFTFISFPEIGCCPDHTCLQLSSAEVPLPENRMLYCKLCNVEISMTSKHCRVCDKCVDGFDHHCRWLNNCIGKRNYRIFFMLMVAALFLFILQWSFGLWILVHRLLNGRLFERIIALRLGRSFPCMVYLFVLVSCSVLAMVATYLLGQLTFFHARLIKNGTTTYDYIMAKRKQGLPREIELRSSSLLPSPDAGEYSGGSCSARCQQEQVEQAVFDHEQGSPQVEICNSKQDKDQGGPRNSFSQRFSKRKASVKINPCNFLNKDDNSQFASTSTNKFSTEQSAVVMAEMGSSFNSSSQGFSADLIASLGSGSASRRFFEINSNHLDASIVSTWQNGKLPLDSLEQLDSSENDSGTLDHQQVRDQRLNPLQREARNVFKSSHSFCSGEVFIHAAEAASSSRVSDLKASECI
eukprot:c21496_g1_i4 orf=645-2138(-)